MNCPYNTGETCSSGPSSEGPACQVRLSMMDDPVRSPGHDKRAPPGSTDAVEGVPPKGWIVWFHPNRRGLPCFAATTKPVHR